MEKDLSVLSFEAIIGIHLDRLNAICVDKEKDPSGHKRQEAKIVCSLVADCLERLSREHTVPPTVSLDDVSELKKVIHESLGVEEDCDKEYEDPVNREEDIAELQKALDSGYDYQAKKLSRKERKAQRRLEKDMKRREKVAKRQEKLRKKIRKTGLGLEPGHAIVSCPDCAARLLIGIEYLEHRN